MPNDPFTSANTKIFIGPVAGAAIITATQFAALTWTEIGLAETLGEFGDESQNVSFTALSSARVQHLKGARDGGTLPLTCGIDPLDPGQIALRLAALTKFSYGVKLVYPDRPNPTGTDTVEYFRALVMSSRRNVGDSNNVMRMSFPLAINSDIVTVGATMGA